MRTLLALAVLVTALFALTDALRLGPFMLLKIGDVQADVDALAFIESSGTAIPDPQLYAQDTGNDDGEVADVAAQFVEVPLPPGRHVALGPPKFPQNIISGASEPYCQFNVTSWNAKCAGICGSIPTCRSYYSFEATNSGQPKLPYWFCYTVNVKLLTSDFKPNVEVNFAYAYNRVS